MQNPPSRVRSPCDLGRLERWKSRAALAQSAGSRGETCLVGPAMAQPAPAGFVRTEPHFNGAETSTTAAFTAVPITPRSPGIYRKPFFSYPVSMARPILLSLLLLFAGAAADARPAPPFRVVPRDQGCRLLTPS